VKRVAAAVVDHLDGLLVGITTYVSQIATCDGAVQQAIFLLNIEPRKSKVNGVTLCSYNLTATELTCHMGIHSVLVVD